MNHQFRQSSQLAQKLFDVLLPETSRAVSTVDDWAVLGTIAGPVRAENQDRMVAGQFTSPDSKTFRVVALSDGMGGLSYGQEAAALTLSSFLWCLTSSNGDIVARLEKGARYANDIVYREFGGKSGATLSAVVVTDHGHPAAVNVGDSRIYGYEPHSRLLKQLSVDDTLAGLSGQGVAVDSRHNSTALLQHVGMGDDFEPNILAPGLLFDKRYLILSTDGIHWIGNKLLELIVQNATDQVQLARRLLQLAEMAGAHDNATLGIIKPDALPEPSANDASPADVELWTPQGRTILILEHGYRSERSNQNFAPEHATRLPSGLEAEGHNVSISKPTRKKAKRRRKPKAAPQDQADFLGARPELVIEFGEPKREEDETSQ